MGSIGVPELIIIFVVALIVFGPRKLPELGKSLGKGLAEFRRASNELRSTIEDEVRAIEAETTTNLNDEPGSKSSSEVNAGAPIEDEVQSTETETATTLNVESESKTISKSSSEVNVDAH